MNAQRQQATGSSIFSKVLLQYHALQHGTCCAILRRTQFVITRLVRNCALERVIQYSTDSSG
jgi:hypothetical protein